MAKQQRIVDLRADKTEDRETCDRAVIFTENADGDFEARVQVLRNGADNVETTARLLAKTLAKSEGTTVIAFADVDEDLILDGVTVTCDQCGRFQGEGGTVVALESYGAWICDHCAAALAHNGMLKGGVNETPAFASFTVTDQQALDAETARRYRDYDAFLAQQEAAN